MYQDFYYSGYVRTKLSELKWLFLSLMNFSNFKLDLVLWSCWPNVNTGKNKKALMLAVLLDNMLLFLLFPVLLVVQRSLAQMVRSYLFILKVINFEFKSMFLRIKEVLLNKLLSFYENLQTNLYRYSFILDETQSK